MKSKAFYIWLLLSILCVIGIYISSSIEGAVSGAASMAIVERIRRFVGMDAQTLHFIVRKGAHFTVYFILAFCVTNTAKYVIKNKKILFWLSWGISSVYGVLDEIHQYFVPNRVFSVMDMIINALGALTAVLLVLFMQRKKADA